MEERHLSLAGAAERLGISERTARRWIKSGKLGAYKPGRDYWIPDSAIRELIEESKVSPKVSAPSSQEKLFNNGVLEDLRRVAGAYASYNEIQKAMDEYREVWEKRLAEGEFEKAAVEEAGRAISAFWPAVAAAADSEMAEQKRYGIQPEEAAAQSVLLPAIARFQALGDKVNSTYRERFQNVPASNVYAFPQREAS